MYGLNMVVIAGCGSLYFPFLFVNIEMVHFIAIQLIIIKIIQLPILLNIPLGNASIIEAKAIIGLAIIEATKKNFIISIIYQFTSKLTKNFKNYFRMFVGISGCVLLLLIADRYAILLCALNRNA